MQEQAQPVFELSMSRISFFNDLLSSVLEKRNSATSVSDERPMDELCRALLSARGEVSGNRLSRSILDGFAEASDEDRLAFFCWMLDELDIDADAAALAIRDYQTTPSAENWQRFSNSSEPARLELLRRINRTPESTEKLVRMREALYPYLPGNDQLARLDADFERLFKLWFNRGFLVLREIDWSTPANILEKIIRYEAVHEINDWKDLRSRLLPPDRKCFAFFHPAMQDEPLIFVEVALTSQLPESIQSILTTERETIEPHEATEAVFYSISNCQPGLRGVSFGNFLIKHVATELAANYPNIKNFRTLSPVPTLMAWLQIGSSPEIEMQCTRVMEMVKVLKGGLEPASSAEEIVFDPMAESVDQAVNGVDQESAQEVSSTLQPDDESGLSVEGEADGEQSIQTESTSDSDSKDEEQAPDAIEPMTRDEIARELCQLAAHYLVEVKRGDSQPRDPVARFHLGNGAALDAVLPLADHTSKGFSQSAGVMVSYLYDLDQVITQHEAYAGSRFVTHSKPVAQLLAGEGQGEKGRFRLPGMRRSA